MPNIVAGKVAIVTGAGRNIGRAIALALADGGASVLVNARSNRAEADAVAREIEAAGGKAVVHIGDVADAAQVQAMAELAAKHFGRIDILVNNVGIGGGGDGPTDRAREEAFDRILTVNLKSAWMTIKHALPVMREQGFGSIVNISSISALRPRGYMVLYGAASGPPPPVEIARLNAASLFLTRPTLSHYGREGDELRMRAGELLEWIAAGELDVRIGGRYPLADAARAQADLERAQSAHEVAHLGAARLASVMKARPNLAIQREP